MIVYALRCDAGHTFDAWFRNSDAFDVQSAKGVVTCALCGSHKVEKALMTPRLGRGGTRAPEPQPVAQAEPKPMGQAETTPPPATLPTMTPASAAQLGPAAALRHKLLELRQIIEKNFDDVGSNFAEEARRIHYRETEPRGIFGSTTPEDAEALREEGIEFGSLPWPTTGDS